MAADVNMDLESKVQLTRIEGKLDLVNDRHETMKGDIVEVKTRLHSHSNRIGVLEARDHQRTGAVGAVKLLWAAGGVTLASIAAFAARSLGL